MSDERNSIYNRKTKLGDIKEATKLALHHRQLVKEGYLGVFLLPLTVALAKDGLLDHLNTVVVGYLLSIPAAVYLFIFMWGRGKWKLRLIVLFLSILDLIPVASELPMSTIYVVWGYYFARKQAEVSITLAEEIEYWIDTGKRRLQIDVQRERIQQSMQEAYTQVFDENKKTESTAKKADPSVRFARFASDRVV